MLFVDHNMAHVGRRVFAGQGVSFCACAAAGAWVLVTAVEARVKRCYAGFEGWVDTGRRDGYESFAGHDVSREAGERARDSGAYIGEDAEEFYQDHAGGSGDGGDVAV